mgnify:FL=1
MNKRSKRYTDEFKMLILELLEEGRTKKSLENEYGVATATIRKWEKEFKGVIDKKYNANEALNEIMALKRQLQQEMDKNSLNFGGHSIYKHLMKEIQLKLDIAKKENQNIRLNIPVALIKQEEFNTVGNPKMFENSKIIHKFPNLPTERGLEKENNFNTRAVYDGDGVID